MSTEPTFSIGIEEEYLLVNRETRDLITEAPPAMLPECQDLLKGQVTPEFLQSQIEVGTRPSRTLRDARSDLAHLRRTVSDVAGQHGLAIIAASTHPFATWTSQKLTEKERYLILARDMQAVIRRIMICGMHVHVGIDDDDLRIDLMGQVSYVLPHLLALSTSSPFWEGTDTGLKSYRIALWDGMPRTGLPEDFDSFGEFRRQLDALIDAGVIEDATKIWWDVRPSARFPTLEARISDVCTLLDDAMCVAALYVCWLRMLYRIRQRNQRWRRYALLLVNENRWRAQRYGFEQGLVDWGKRRIVPYGELLEEVLDLIAEDAEALGCTAEVAHARTILARGTSAHRQVAAYRAARANGATDEAALRAVVDMLIAETTAQL